MKLKKSIVAIIALVAVCALSLCVFVGCNNGDKETPAATNNAETLGTAVAAAAQYMGGAAAGAAAEDTDNFEEGVNLEFDASASISGIGAFVNTAIDAVKPVIENVMEPIVEQGVKAVQELVGDKDVQVTTAESDKDGYNTKLIVSIYDVDENGEKVLADEYVLYLNIKDGKDIESKEFNYTASIVAKINDKEVEIFSFDGSAAYDAEIGSVAFNFSLGAAGIADVDFTATATKDGNVVLAIDTAAFESFNAGVEIEIGKLDGGKYGAIVTVTGDAKINVVVAEANANFKAIINVSAAEVQANEEYSLDLAGSVEIGVSVTYGETVYAYDGSATLNGQAKYLVESDDLTVGIKGTVAFNYSNNQAK